LIGGWNIFCVSLAPKILILKSIGGQIILNSHWLLKDEEAIDWRGGFRTFHWAKGISLRKGHESLPSGRHYVCVFLWEEKEEKEGVRKKKD